MRFSAFLRLSILAIVFCGILLAAAAAPIPVTFQHPISRAPVGNGLLARESPLALVYQDDDWTILSRQINTHICAAFQGGDIWLGTAMGVKHLDFTRGAVRHHTAADGFPGSAVHAIAAGREYVWALTGVSALQKLCRYDRAVEKWEVLGEIKTPAAQEKPPIAVRPFDNLILASDGSSCFLASCTSDATPTPPIRVWDHSARAPKTIGWDPSITAGHPKLSISWMEADGQNLWLATDLGLLTYSLRTHKWKRSLPGLAICAASRDDQTVWAAGLRGPTGKGKPAWVVRQFDAATETGEQYAVPSGAQGLPAYVAEINGALWLTFMNGANLTMYRLDLVKGEWKPVPLASPRDLEAVPSFALMGPTWPRRDLLVNLAPSRTADWYCPEQPLPRDMLPYQPRTNFQAGEPGTGAVWRLDDTELVRTDRFESRSYPLGAISALEGAKLGSRSIVVDGNYAWIAGSATTERNRTGTPFLARFRRLDRQFEPLSLTGVPDGVVPWRMMADGESLWLLSPKGAYRRDPESGAWASAAKVLSVPNGDFRVVDAMPDRLLVWCVPDRVSQKTGGSAPGVLARLDRETGKTTWFDPLPGVPKTGRALLVEEDRVWVSCSRGVFRFDRRTEKWEPVPFPIKTPEGFVWSPERIQYAEGGIWFTDDAVSVRWKPRRPQ